ncbi:Bcr/CflA family drug resistance efflux transporter [Shewanella sp. OPT22]|nr:Bcr/CflA family drug resistance efflux transporter [Shewanella sp. OPT22]
MKQLRLIAILLPMVIFSPLAIDIFLPALPTMATEFDVPVTQMQWTITIFIFSLGLGQLFFGPISDKIGRRPVLLLGIVTYLITALVMIFIQSIELHLLLRFFQGLGACAIVVSVFASVTDRFNAKESSQIYSYLNGMIFCTPALAPVMGYFLTTNFGWKSNFIFMALFAVIFGVIALRFFNESYTPKVDSISISKILVYKKMISSSSFIFYTFIVMLSFASSTAFVSMAPNVFIHKFKLNEEVFTHWFSLNAVTIIAVNLLTPKLINHFKINSIIKIGLGIVILSGGLLLALQNNTNVASFMLPVIIGSIGFSLLMGTCTGKALTPFKANAGAASALFGFIQMSISALIVTLAQALAFSATEQLVIFALCFIPLLVIKFLRDSEKEPTRI